MLNTGRNGRGAGVAALLLIGPVTALGQTTVIEDFEGFTVPVVLDPSTVDGSGWTRGGADSSDWDVICCDGDFATLDGTFDGSEQFLALRRSNTNPPGASNENTDFALPTIVEGSVSLEVNPASPGGAGFRMSLHDSGTGSRAMEIIHTESGWPVINSGDFRVFNEFGAVLAEGTTPNDPNGENAMNRWFRILVTLNGNGTYDVNIFDIGPAKNSVGATLPLGDPARGLVLTLTGASLPVASVDSFRLSPGSTNGGGLQPTLIDNIVARDFFATVGVEEIKAGAEISFPVEAGSVYQPQFSDDGGTWSDLGELVLGFAPSTMQSVVASTIGAPAHRTYRVLEF